MGIDMDDIRPIVQRKAYLDEGADQRIQAVDLAVMNSAAAGIGPAPTSSTVFPQKAFAGSSNDFG